MTMEFDFSAFERSLDATKKRIVSAAEKGMADATYKLLEDSRELAPLAKDGGALRSQAWAEVSEEGGVVTGEVYYSVTEQSDSGERFNYALYQHELGESYANPSTPGTQPKFLERPLKQNAGKYKQMIADAIREELS